MAKIRELALRMVLWDMRVMTEDFEAQTKVFFIS